MKLTDEPFGRNVSIIFFYYCVVWRRTFFLVNLSLGTFSNGLIRFFSVFLTERHSRFRENLANQGGTSGDKITRMMCL